MRVRVSGVSPLDIAERALAAAAGEALVTVTRERSVMLRFARSRPTQATAVDDLTVEVAALRNGHVGRAATNRTDAVGLRQAADAAALAAETAAVRGAGRFPGFPGPAAPRAHGGHDAETAAVEAATGGEALAATFAAAGAAGVDAGGIWTAAETETAIASSAGALLSDRVTDAFMKVVAIAPSGLSGYAAAAAVAQSRIDARALAERAAGKAMRGAEPTQLPAGDYPVVFEPHAVSEILWVLGQAAFDGLAHGEGRGALSGKLGAQVASPAINLSDSPGFPSTLPRGFDAEGVPKAPLPLIEDGVARAVVHDTRSGALAGASSTGHAMVAGGAVKGPRPTNLVLVGGGEAGEEELCGQIERGVYVTRLWYTNVVQPGETLFTAVTRDGTFLIEDGVVTRPLTDMRVTDSALGVLARTRALGSRASLSSDGEFYGRRFATGSVCPPLLVEGVRFTGTAGAQKADSFLRPRSSAARSRSPRRAGRTPRSSG